DEHTLASALASRTRIAADTACWPIGDPVDLRSVAARLVSAQAPPAVFFFYACSMSSANGRLPRACVIGAGSSGIAVVKALHERSIPFDCFEASDQVGALVER